MAEFFIERVGKKDIDYLHEQFQAVSGYQSCSINPRGVVVHHENGDIAGFRAVLDAYHGDELSSKEIQMEALRNEIQTLKAQVGDIDNLTATEATSGIQLLYKVLRVHDLI